MNNRAATILLSQALLVGSLPRAVVTWTTDWYVSVNWPLCPGGDGTQARPFCDIMDAVAAATDGDTIHIAPGTYFENVVLDKELNLIGTGGQQVTILDGGANGSVVWVLAPATLTGLTMTNGTGTTRIIHGKFGQFPYTLGGGVCVEPGFEGPVTLTSCSVSGNTADLGCAIGNVGYLPNYGYRTTGPLSISNSTVGGNVDTGNSNLQAAIIKTTNAASPLTISNSALQGNASVLTVWFGGNGNEGSLEISDTSIKDNAGLGIWATGGIGGIDVTIARSAVSDNEGGGIFFESASVAMVDSTISNNSSSGIFVYDALTTITNSTVEANGGDGIFVLYSPNAAGLALINSTVSGNSGVGVRVGFKGVAYGGGYFYYGASASITNSTITDNAVAAVYVTGSLTSPYSSPSHATLENSIVWNNGLSSIQLDGTGATCAVDYSLIEGGWPGVGNLNTDPLFVDPLNGDIRLMSGSPCIDAGDNRAVPIGIFTDLDGKRRFIDDPLAPDTGNPGGLWPIVDMGAYEFGVDRSRGVRESRLPVAQFAGTPTRGAVPLFVTFTDASGREPASWLWDFGDGATSSLQHPVHTYTSVGTYTVALSVSNAFGTNTRTRVGYLEVLPIVVDFSGTPRNGGLPLSVSFTDLTANAPTSWLWDFGDGAISSEQHPTHVYTSPGTFTVSLTASNGLATDTVTRTAYVEALPVTADFTGAPRSGGLPLSASFTDLSANAPTSWSWDFGDGGTSSEQHPTHTYTTVGTFTVSLTASNAFTSGTETKATYVQALAVVANFRGVPRNGGLPLSVIFTDLSANSPTSWSWDFGDGATSSLRHPHHTYTSVGFFTVSLTASNAFSSDAETKTAYIQTRGVTANFSGTPRSGEVPLTVSFTDLSANSPTSWSWDFGDGATSTLQHPTHTYSSPGVFTVSMTASDTYSSDTETKANYIQVGLVAEFTGTPRGGPSPLTVSFTDLSTGSPTSWSWDFGDGTTSSEQHPTHVYAGPGNFTVSLTVTTALGSDTELKFLYILVGAP